MSFQYLIECDSRTAARSHWIVLKMTRQKRKQRHSDHVSLHTWCCHRCKHHLHICLAFVRFATLPIALQKCSFFIVFIFLLLVLFILFIWHMIIIRHRCHLPIIPSRRWQRIARNIEARIKSATITDNHVFYWTRLVRWVSRLKINIEFIVIWFVAVRQNLVSVQNKIVIQTR